MEDKKITDDFIFTSRYNLDRVALAIQFLEKTSPREDIKNNMSLWVYTMLTKKTEIKNDDVLWDETVSDK